MYFFTHPYARGLKIFLSAVCYLAVHKMIENGFGTTVNSTE